MAYRSNSNHTGNEDDRGRRNEDPQGRWQDFERERGGSSSHRPNEGRFSGNQDYQTGGFGNRGNEGQSQQGQGRYGGQDYDRGGLSGGGYEGRGDYGSGGSGTYGSGGVTLGGNYNTGGGTGPQEHQSWSPGRGFHGNPGNYGGSQGSQSTRNESWQGRGSGRNEEYRFGSGEGSSGFGQQTGTGGPNYGWRGREPWDQGPHSGRGPQGYQRSSETIKEEACERLTRHGHVDASGIRIQVENGEITLEGTVKTRREKRLAEEALESLSGVRDIHNRLRVEGGILSSLFGGGSGSSDQEKEGGAPPARTEAVSSTGSATLGDPTGDPRSRNRK